MRCPKCGSENATGRTICSECGHFMYRADISNRARMTKAQRRREDIKYAGKNVGKVARIVWMILVMLVTSFWIIALLVWLTER